MKAECVTAALVVVVEVDPLTMIANGDTRLIAPLR